MTTRLVLACAACDAPLPEGGRQRHLCRPDLTTMPPLRLYAYKNQVFRTPGKAAVDELERIRDEYERRPLSLR